MGFDRQIREALAALESAGLVRHPVRVSGPQGPEIRIDGQRVLCFCSNNYLGLANHPEIRAACEASARREGVGAAASRLITGTMDAHLEAEDAFADFLGATAAVFFSSGYAANLGAVQALVGPGDAIFSDALNHASLVDGCRLSRARVHVYRHRDTDHLESLLREHRGSFGRALILTDAVFSMDGVIAPLRRIETLARSFQAGLLVDEAHSLGIFGPAGRGLCAALGIAPDLLVAPLGKAFGVAGAFVAASQSTASMIRNRARSFVYSTAPPPLIPRAALRALALVREADDARVALLSNASKLCQGLRELGFEIPSGETQILPVWVGPNDRTMQLSANLLERGVFVQGIRPPSVPEGTARLRLTLMAAHRTEHIDRALQAFASLAREDKE